MVKPEQEYKEDIMKKKQVFIITIMVVAARCNGICGQRGKRTKKYNEYIEAESCCKPNEERAGSDCQPNEERAGEGFCSR